MAEQQPHDWRQALVNIGEAIRSEIDKDRDELNQVLISIGEAYVEGKEKNIPPSDITRARKLTARIDGMSWCYQLPAGYLGGMFIIPTNPEPPAAE